MAANKNIPGQIDGLNTFEDGLIADLHPMSSPSSAMSNALNMEFVTIGGDQYVLQNIRGNKHTFTLPKYRDKYPMIPLGVKVFNNIAYIIAGAFATDDNGKVTQVAGTIGTFPSPDWTALNSTGSSEMIDVFSPLHNFDASGNDVYDEALITTRFNFVHNAFIDIKTVGSYDGSVDIIFTDDKIDIKVINSRFYLDDAGIAHLADRAGEHDTNIYSEARWNKTLLLNDSTSIIKVNGPIVEGGGKLLGGGYRYYFRYASQEGNLSNIIYESPLIPVSDGTLGVGGNFATGSSVEFELSELDITYGRIKVYFQHMFGDTAVQSESYEIDNNFLIDMNTRTCSVVHSGYEKVTAVDTSAINTRLTSIDSAKSIEILNNRLLIANTNSKDSSGDFVILKEAAAKLSMTQHSRQLDGDYGDARNVISSLGYWRGEVYEFAVVFILTDGGYSPAFPIKGTDFEYTDRTDPANPVEHARKDNSLGVVRGTAAGRIYSNDSLDLTGHTVSGALPLYFKCDTSSLATDGPVNEIAAGFFLVRRERRKNAIVQGMLIPTMGIAEANRSVGVSEFGKMFYAENRVTKEFKAYHASVGIFLGITEGMEQQFVDEGRGAPDYPGIKQVPQPTQYLEMVDYFGTIGAAASPYIQRDPANRIEPETSKVALYSGDLETDSNNIFEKLSSGIGSLVHHTDGVQPIAKIERETKANNRISGEAVCYATYEQAVKECSDVFCCDVCWKCHNRKKRCWDRAQDEKKKCLANESSAGENGRIFSVLTTYWEDVEIKVDTEIFEDVHIQSVYSGLDIKVANMFTGLCDRELSYIKSAADTSVANRNYYNATINRTQKIGYASYRGGKYIPHATLFARYSSYLGIDTKIPVTFEYRQGLTNSAKNITDNVGRKNFADGNIYKILFGNVGNVASLYSNRTGMWDGEDILTMFTNRASVPYFAVTDRLHIDTAEVDVFRGDGYINKTYKRFTYKAGVGEPSAVSSDSAFYGVGIMLDQELDDAKAIDEIKDERRDDLGRGLFDQGQVIELVSYTNTNTALRSEERLSASDSAEQGRDRSYYPLKPLGELRADSRPDSAAYNHGYTGANSLLPYFALIDDAPTFASRFPNRITASPQNTTQKAFNSFKNIRGFNYRDYGIELGPIQKIIAISGMLLSIHEGGVVGVGVDDRTLLGEGTDVYVDSVEALSPKGMPISDKLGTQHAESIIKTDTTIMGVDYMAGVIWTFDGVGLTNVSEFTVRTVINSFKKKIDEAPGLSSRVYGVFNKQKHIAVFTFVGQDAVGNQTQMGSIVYNDNLKRWVTLLSDGHKFIFDVNSRAFTFGTTAISDAWEEDALFEGGVPVRCRMRGNDYNHEFELVVNDTPQVEKILSNIKMVTNKSIPIEVEYRISGDVNDAALNVWGPSISEKLITQTIYTRNNNSLSTNSRLAIIQENAYYKDSALYIEVSRGPRSLRRPSASTSNKLIRDKYIKIKFIYTGNDETFIQTVLTTLRVSYG